MSPNGSAQAASVIVCTRNQAGMLERSLRSILADRSEIPRELIVIDNGSTDETREVVRTLATIGSDIAVRYDAESRPGLSHARNRGVAVARGRFLLFTDDDVVVEDGWADALVAGFSRPDVGAVGGRILPRWPFPPPPWMQGPHAARLTLVDFGPVAREFVSPSELPIGANMAVRAEIARSTPFDPALGVKRRMKLQFEEWHFLARIRAGYALVYQPSAVVFHCIPPERITWEWMRRAHFQLGFGLARKERLEGEEQLSLPRRIVRAARTCRAALRTRSENERATALDAERAWREFSDYMWAGKHLEMLLANHPRLSDWLAGHVV
jgi:glycosyltransferase involved in cell wall biosynthesis